MRTALTAPPPHWPLRATLDREKLRFAMQPAAKYATQTDLVLTKPCDPTPKSLNGVCRSLGLI